MFRTELHERYQIHGSAVQRFARTTPGEIPYNPPNLKIGDLKPAYSQFGDTTADRAGCSMYERLEANSVSDSLRLPKLVVGRITFGVFVIILAVAAWYVLGIAMIVAKLVLIGLGHAGLALAFRAYMVPMEPMVREQISQRDE